MTPQYEKTRQEIQARLDSLKAADERNRLGQFATPLDLAMEMIHYAHSLFLEDAKISFLDPAFGTGAFYSALMTVFSTTQIAKATGFEIDTHYRDPAIILWSDTALELLGADFTQVSPPTREDDKYDAIICNPPYVRHHHIMNEEKVRLQYLTERIFGEPVSGLAGLYCYFIGLSHLWMKENGVAGWLIPSEFMDVNYGGPVKRYLLNQVTLMRIHRFDPIEVQFKDALVSSAVVWFRKAKPSKDHAVEFTFGGTLKAPKVKRIVPASVLLREPKWTRFPVAAEREISSESRLGDFFEVRRGLATGDNNFFILSKKQIDSHSLPTEVFRPVLPSPRFLKVDEICADDQGNPILDPQLFLLDCRVPPDIIRMRYPTLWDYLETGRQEGVSERYLCRHRTPWYVQENRLPSLFVCTYMGRGVNGRNTPFRFILNHSKATVTNTYLILYPRTAVAAALEDEPALVRRIWSALNEIDADVIRGEGRIYGGGLHKIEPKELSNVPADTIKSLVHEISRRSRGQQELFDQPFAKIHA
jgi:adenine-specific DNA-methyltransferase